MRDFRLGACEPLAVSKGTRDESRDAWSFQAPSIPGVFVKIKSALKL